MSLKVTNLLEIIEDTWIFILHMPGYKKSSPVAEESQDLATLWQDFPHVHRNLRVNSNPADANIPYPKEIRSDSAGSWCLIKPYFLLAFGEEMPINFDDFR